MTKRGQTTSVPPSRERGAGAPGPIRCAIYTRKSSEEGLELEFNSLDAQREAAEAYIASQRNEGWICLPDRYDDGGFSGGSMERPALEQLLKDIEAGKVDCVVVYKVDRLSRSLMDFARIMETFDRKGVSFVSVTQQFNTTSSMGRLTLNILLSFAQFEREIIGERIRDKIAAQKRRGKWAGGVPILGYDVDRSGSSPRLVVNPREAAKVRAIFQMYLDKGSLQRTVTELRHREWKNKRRVTKKGVSVGGQPFNTGTLHVLLTNPLLTGKIVHRGNTYDGEHEAIVDPALFERVRQQLLENGRTGGIEMRNKYGALLRGLLRCKKCDCAMIHTFYGKKEQAVPLLPMLGGHQERGAHLRGVVAAGAGDREARGRRDPHARQRPERCWTASSPRPRSTQTRNLTALKTERASIHASLGRIGEGAAGTGGGPERERRHHRPAGRRPRAGQRRTHPPWRSRPGWA
jgi:site-specific DNA recombinase